MRLLYVHFNPRPREGCDRLNVVLMRRDILISIHAPVKGATIDLARLDGRQGGISIHAPVKGATLLM